MDKVGILDRNSIIDLFALHYIYQPRTQASLDDFKEGTITQSPREKTVPRTKYG